jgi:fumarate reductase flavoprotein subunit
MVENMMAEVEKLHVPMMFNTKVVELLHDDMLRCTGVKAVSPEGPLVIHAKGGVILATGGFHANKALVTQFMGGEVAWMPIRGSMTLTGENILLTAPFFPMYVNMDQFHAGPIHGPTKANPSQMVNFGICVNTLGNRYVDEASTYVEIARHTAKDTIRNSAFIILDSAVVKLPIVAMRIDRYKAAKAPIFEANSIGELASKIGVPAKALEKTVSEYNDAVHAGRGASLKVPATMKKPYTIEKGPFLAVPFSGGMTATFGGPKISLKGEVLNTESKPVPGLYAAGNAIGGLFYDDYLSGSQLGAAVIWGRVGADEAAARAKAA